MAEGVNNKIDVLTKLSHEMKQSFTVVEQNPMDLNNLMSFMCSVANRLDTMDHIIRELLQEESK